MSTLGDLKDTLIRKIATTFLLKYLDGYKTDIARVAQSVNMLIAGAYLAAQVIDVYTGTHLTEQLDWVNDKWLLAIAVFAHAGIEFGIADGKAKAKEAEKALE